MKKETHGYLVALETWSNEPPPDAKTLSLMIQELLNDHGYVVEVSVEGMGKIDCYEGENG